MADVTRNSDGQYVDTLGGTHSSKESAASMNNFVGSFFDLVWKAVLYIPILGAMVCIFMVLVAGGRGFVILAKTFWLFGLCAIPAVYIFARVFMWFWQRGDGFRGLLSKGFMKIIFALFFRFMVSIAAGATVTAPLFWLSYKHYCRSEMHFASKYSADYVQALPDGKAPAVYEKRFQKGKILAELSIGEKVTVNGITVGLAEYNVTTADGTTGWVARAAFPEEAADMLSININADGFDSEDIAVDREIERMMERYMDVKETGGGTYKGYEIEKHTEYSISQNTLNRSIKVNAQTPLMLFEHEAYKKGADFAGSDAKVTLENILYADDCTVLYITVTDAKVRDLSGTFNTTAWKKSLTVKDLDTGEIFPILQADYKQTWKYEQIKNDWKSSIVFFFPPFKSRHFSLTHEAPALMSGGKTGYGGILGLAASVTSGGTATEYVDYNFVEIRVK